MMASASRSIAIVTGGARRLGKAISLNLAKAGWDIFVHYGSSEQSARSTVDEIRSLGRRAESIQADFSDPDQLKFLIFECEKQLGAPQLLVNNASMFEYDNPSVVEHNLMHTHYCVNTTAPIILSKNFYEATLRRINSGVSSEKGVIINILDQKLNNPNPDFFSYTLSKAALHSATTLLAQAFAPHVRVMGIAPGITLPFKDQSDEEFRAAHSMTILGQSSTADDVCNAVAYVASANAMTGTTLFVDGGQHLQPSPRDVIFQVNPEKG